MNIFLGFVLNLLNFILMTDNIYCPSKSRCHSIDEPTLKHSNYSRIKIKKNMNLEILTISQKSIFYWDSHVQLIPGF